MIKRAGESLKIGKMGKSVWLVVIAIVIAIILAYTAFYTIPPGNQGVILRFGRYSGMALPGLHFKIPFGVDTVFKVHTAQVDTGRRMPRRPGSMETLTVRIRPSMPFLRRWRRTKGPPIRTPLLFLEPTPTITGS
jgi:regulator of protease activity HflC (stomatin/prohibitin superfamily)